MALNLVTGTTGTPHITSAEKGLLNANVVGTGKYVFSNGDQFAVTIPDTSKPAISIASGSGIMNGRFFILPKASSLILSSSTEDTYYCVYFRYALASDGTESMSILYTNGTSASVLPPYNNNSVISGDSNVDMPLVTLHWNGSALSLSKDYRDIVYTSLKSAVGGDYVGDIQV